MKLVVIEWLDSHSGPGWQRLADIKQNAATVLCRSVGWLLHRDKKATVIVPHISGEKNDDAVPYGSGDLSIPNPAIIKIRVLE